MAKVNVFASSAVMAAGTIASRALGFLRAIILVTAVAAVSPAGSAFQLANTIPNLMYMLIIGGALNAVLVPQITAASKAPDGGREYTDRLLTLALAAMAIVTIVLTLLAPLLIRLYSDGLSDATLTLAVTMAYICVPQVFFYGLYTLVGQVLNARGSFGPYMWAPALNNIVAIAGLLIFIALYGQVSNDNPTAAPDQWTPAMIWLLAGTATLGIIAQALILIPFLYRDGYRYTPRWGMRGVGLGSASSVAGWTFLAAVVGQLVFITTSRVTTSAGSAVTSEGLNEAGRYVANNASYANAFLLFMLPHSIIVVSLVTALFTRISRNVVAEKPDAVNHDFSMALRVIGLVTILSTTGLVVLRDAIGAAIAQTYGDAVTIAAVTAVMALGLLPFSSTYMMQRLYYAFEDGKSPFLAQLPNFAVIVACNAIAFFALPSHYQTIGVAAGMALGNFAGMITIWTMLKPRLAPGLTKTVLTSWLRFLPAAIVAGSIGSIAVWYVPDASRLSRPEAVGFVAIVGLVMVTTYFGTLIAMRAPEAKYVINLVRRRVSRSAPSE